MLHTYPAFPLGDAATPLLAVSREADPDEIVEFAGDILRCASTTLYLVETTFEANPSEKHRAVLYGVQMMLDISIGLIESIKMLFDEYPPKSLAEGQAEQSAV